MPGLEIADTSGKHGQTRPCILDGLTTYTFVACPCLTMSLLYLLTVATPFGVSRRQDTVPCPPSGCHTQIPDRYTYGSTLIVIDWFD
jgi:hypothetical protein